MTKFKQYRVAIRVLGALILAFLASLWQEIGGAMSGVIVQFGWCLESDPFCTLQIYIKIAFGLLVAGIIVDLVINRINKQKLSPAEKHKKEDSIEDAITLTAKPRENYKYASIIVKNNSPNKPIFCTPYLERAEWQYNLTTQIPIDIDAKELSWHQGSDEPEVEIKPGREKIINVARTDGNDLVFTLFSGNLQESSVGKHYIWVEVLWRVGKEGAEHFRKTWIGCIDDIFSDPKNKVGRYKMPNGSWRGLFVSGINIWECDDGT